MMKHLLAAAAAVVVLLAPVQGRAESREFAKLRNAVLDGAHRGAIVDAYASARSVAAGRYAMDGSFLAGMIAFRYLNRPDIAAEHFKQMALLTDEPAEKSKAGFWLGRALAAMGRADDARKAYLASAQHAHTFYGQAAAARTGVKIELPAAARRLANASDIQAALATPEGQLARAAQIAGNKPVRNAALKRISAGDARRLVIGCGVASEIGAYDFAVDMARQGERSGISLVDCGWPQVKVGWTDPRGPRELVWAVAREESKFDQIQQSGKGAQGFMQVMPGTAQHVGRRAGIAIDPVQMRINRDYNVAVGSNYLAGLLAQFAGNPVLAVAAYNAGPQRVNEWLAARGDPRTGAVDVVDWIEEIPFSETRNYVKKVVANYVVYLAKGRVQSADAGR
ncbi:lytic transglycosylase domain-containing protein [Methylobacterium radiotolerans]|uniref:lytic transglycosylase domain-containing protein n=1 Tax=Methylobacterium radiotolerans TaxID=31998 RepID=UPI0038CFB2FD